MPDFEKRFYEILSVSGVKVPENKIRQDFFDARNGTHIGLTGSGNVAMLLVMPPRAVPQFVQAFEGTQQRDMRAIAYMGDWMADIYKMMLAIDEALSPADKKDRWFM